MKEIGVMIRQAVRAIAKDTDIPVCVMVVGQDILECSSRDLLEAWKEEKILYFRVLIYHVVFCK